MHVGPAHRTDFVEALEDRRHLAAQPLRAPEDYTSELLSAADVRLILARAASQALPGQAIVVTDREGVIRGSFRMSGVPASGKLHDLVVGAATSRARTAAAFQSTQNAFTTRTARFIVQDHFPHPVQNTPGGPLYGVEFSNQPFSDILLSAGKDLPAGAVPLNISGDPGGIPLFKNGIPVGGVGVAGDQNDVAVRQDLIPLLKQLQAPFDFNPQNRFYNGGEESDVDEQVALAGAQGFMANEKIQATRIFLDGLRPPFTADKARAVNPVQSLAQLDGDEGSIETAPQDATLQAFPRATFAGVGGELKNTTVGGFGIVTSNDSSKNSRRLTAANVSTIITDAVHRAIGLRSAIREPQGVPARIHAAVVDRDGDVLGVFRMDDGTNFSFDVAVQKARTAAFFSDDTHALSARAVGFMSQAFFAPGIKSSGPGPLFRIQNELSTNPANFTGALKNGITIFPGGVPLYKKGRIVGAIGISGDGIEQDDYTAFSGGQSFAPAKSIRSDFLGETKTVAHLQEILENKLFAPGNFSFSSKRIRFATQRTAAGLDDIRLPYVKLPRDPFV